MSLACLPIPQVGLHSLLFPLHSTVQTWRWWPRSEWKEHRTAMRCYPVQFRWDGVHVCQSQPLHKQLNLSHHDSYGS